MIENSSFDELMNRLRTGDDAAAAAVFRRFTDQLIHLARCQLEPWARFKSRKQRMREIVWHRDALPGCEPRF